MKLLEENGEILEKLLRDPLCRQVFPRGIRRDIVKQVIEDEELRKVDEERVSWMTPEQLERFLGADEKARPEEELEALITSGGEQQETVPAAGSPSAGAGGRFRIVVEQMGTQAKIILNRPKDGEPKFDIREFRLELVKNGIVRGVRPDFLSRLAKRPVYGKKFRIAEGKMPVDGENGRAVYHFTVPDELGPHIDERGVADYKSMNFVNSVKRGELLCEILAPTEGQDGYDVYGETLKGHPGRPLELKCGANTVMSEDGSKIYAVCDGQAFMKNGEVSVFPVMRLRHVDASTGNIGYDGAVIVEGGVAGGFTIIAGGDIIVRGAVEGAMLVAGGNIMLLGGMRGMRTGSLNAAGSIRSPFIENAAVSAGRCVCADLLTNCRVECGYKIILTGKDCSILGGDCSAGVSIKARRIGNEARVPTRVSIRDIALFNQAEKELKSQIEKRRETAERLRDMAARVSEGGNTLASQYFFAKMLFLKWAMEQDAARMEETIAEDKKREGRHMVEIHYKMYPNVTLEVDGAALQNEETVLRCVAVNSNGKIVFAELEN